MTAPYVLETEIRGLPRTTNTTRVHWIVKHRLAAQWKKAVWHATYGQIPEVPLQKAKLTLIRCSSNRPDYDGLVSSFKHVIDGLKQCGVIADDKHENIGVPVYDWQYARPKQGKIMIRVEQI